MSRPNLQSRAAAVLCDVVLNGFSLDEALNHSLKKNKAQKALLQEMCYGTLRHYDRLSYILNQLLKKPFKQSDIHIEILLLLGLYQLQKMRMPHAISVAETVNAVNASWAKGLVNAVLRNFLRQQATLTEERSMPQTALFSHPQWMIDLWKNAFPQHWQTICNTNNTRPPMSLRINLAKISKSNYCAKLTENNVVFHDITTIPSAIILDQPVSVDALPGFNEGLVSVQDVGAQYLTSILDLSDNLTILDACSAPGGKLLQIIETAPASTRITAVEIDAHRMDKIKDNLQRLHYVDRVKLITADILNTQDWWDGTLYDRIIADVPCSATGVIRRHPDIKLLREISDIAQFAATQYSMLTTLWPCLKPGGLLIYITCSICPQENDDAIQKFLSHHKDAQNLSIIDTRGIAQQHGIQFLPGLYEGDGFYYAKLQKPTHISQ